VERGVTYHGIALNVCVDLADFELIDACGMPGVVSTSIERELVALGGTATTMPPPPTPSVERAAWTFAEAFAAAMDAPLRRAG
jgi:lipoate-protein ligase B